MYPGENIVLQVDFYRPKPSKNIPKKEDLRRIYGGSWVNVRGQGRRGARGPSGWVGSPPRKFGVAASRCGPTTALRAKMPLKIHRPSRLRKSPGVVARRRGVLVSSGGGRRRTKPTSSRVGITRLRDKNSTPRLPSSDRPPADADGQAGRGGVPMVARITILRDMNYARACRPQIVPAVDVDGQPPLPPFGRGMTRASSDLERYRALGRQTRPGKRCTGRQHASYSKRSRGLGGEVKQVVWTPPISTCEQASVQRMRATGTAESLACRPRVL